MATTIFDTSFDAGLDGWGLYEGAALDGAGGITFADATASNSYIYRTVEYTGSEAYITFRITFSASATDNFYLAVWKGSEAAIAAFIDGEVAICGSEASDQLFVSAPPSLPAGATPVTLLAGQNDASLVFTSGGAMLFLNGAQVTPLLPGLTTSSFGSADPDTGTLTIPSSFVIDSATLLATDAHPIDGSPPPTPAPVNAALPAGLDTSWEAAQEVAAAASAMPTYKPPKVVLLDDFTTGVVSTELVGNSPLVGGVWSMMPNDPGVNDEVTGLPIPGEPAWASPSYTGGGIVTNTPNYNFSYAYSAGDFIQASSIRFRMTLHEPGYVSAQSEASLGLAVPWPVPGAGDNEFGVVTFRCYRQPDGSYDYTLGVSLVKTYGVEEYVGLVEEESPVTPAQWPVVIEAELTRTTTGWVITGYLDGVVVVQNSTTFGVTSGAIGDYAVATGVTLALNGDSGNGVLMSAVEVEATYGSSAQPSFWTGFVNSVEEP